MGGLLGYLCLCVLLVFCLCTSVLVCLLVCLFTSVGALLGYLCLCVPPIFAGSPFPRLTHRQNGLNLTSGDCYDSLRFFCNSVVVGSGRSYCSYDAPKLVQSNGISLRFSLSPDHSGEKPAPQGHCTRFKSILHDQCTMYKKMQQSNKQCS